MGAIVLLLLGGAAIVAAAKAKPAGGEAAPDAVSVGSDFPSTGGGIRTVTGGAMQSIETPQQVPVGSGFGYAPPPAAPILPTVQLPPLSASTPIATVTQTMTQALKSALPTIYSVGSVSGLSTSIPGGGGGSGGASFSLSTTQKAK